MNRLKREMAKRANQKQDDKDVKPTNTNNVQIDRGNMEQIDKKGQSGAV
jgi:hypothetical protein